MSVFEVKVRQIDKLEPHPNADKLEVVVIGGYRAVVQKDIHKVGNLILYIPEDTIFIDIAIAEKLKVASYLTGKYKNRVKAVRLRGLLSQGIVLPMSAFVTFMITHDDGTEMQWQPAFQPFPETDPELWANSCSEDIISILKLAKYEEPIPLEMAGHVRRWPTFLTKYDVENVKRPESMAALIEGEEVVATEKLHGTNFSVAIGPGLEDGEEAFVCSRNNALKESETNVYWRAVRKYDLIEKAKEIYKKYHPLLFPKPETTVSLHGEIVGVQDLKYGFINGEIGFFAFDIKINGEFLNHSDFMEICNALQIPMVPIVYTGPYNYDTLTALAQGKTALKTGDILEGLVVKPLVERYDPVAGRVQFKFISEDYLLRKGGSELH